MFGILGRQGARRCETSLKLGMPLVIIDQIYYLLKRNGVSPNDVKGLGLAVPGPLDSINGKILDTPNLKILSNYSIAEDFEKKLKLMQNLR